MIWEYEQGCFEVLRTDDGGVRLLTEEDGNGEVVVIDPADIPDIALEMFKAAGLPVPVGLERPAVDTSVSADVGPVRVWLSEGGEVVLSLGSVAQPLGSRAEARKVASTIAAYADRREVPGDA